MAIRGARQRLVFGVEFVLDGHEGRCTAGVQERVESREQLALGAAALRELKPQGAGGIAAAGRGPFLTGRSRGAWAGLTPK